MPARSHPRSPRPVATALLAGLTLLTFFAPSVSAQDALGAPRPGCQFHFQPSLTFSTLAADASEGVQFDRRRNQSYNLRVSRHLLSAASAFVELGAAARETRARGDGFAPSSLRTRWWEAGLGVNVALRCVQDLVCPSVDAGGVLARNRDAIVRDQTGRPVGSVPVARYEQSLLVGVRLVVPRLRDVALLVRHQHGLSNLALDFSDAETRSRVFLLGAAIPLSN